jgi:hypothetical protein
MEAVGHPQTQTGPPRSNMGFDVIPRTRGYQSFSVLPAVATRRGDHDGVACAAGRAFTNEKK